MKSSKYGSLRFFLNHYAVNDVMRWENIFSRRAELEVEIGFGTGEYLARLATQRPQNNFVGLEQNTERIHKSLRKIDQLGLTNIRLMHVDARLALNRFFQPDSIDAVHCLFPCPWPNQSQIKHRLFSNHFLQMLNNRLRIGGQIQLVTDHARFALWVNEQVDQTGFDVEQESIPARYNTKFERKWRQAGQEKFYAFKFIKTGHIHRPSFEEIVLKVYFWEHFDHKKFGFEDQHGNPSIIFKDFIFDQERLQGMVHLVVAEDFLEQHVWVKILKTQHKGWCLAVADGSPVISTPGVAAALEALYNSIQGHCKK